MSKSIISFLMLAVISSMPYDANGSLDQPLDVAAKLTPAPNVSCPGNGTKDASDCIQNIFDNHISTIVFPENKNYLISKPLTVPSGKKLIGNGSRIFTYSAPRLLYIIGSNITVDNFTFDYLSPIIVNSYGNIHLGVNISDIIIKNNLIKGVNAMSGILLDGENNHIIKIKNNTIKDTNYGILFNILYFGNRIESYPSEIKITSNKILNVNADAIEINSPINPEIGGSGTPILTTSRIEIVDNELSAPYGKADDSGFCIGMAGVYNSIISGNKLHDCKWQAIHIEDRSSFISINNNTIFNTIGYASGDPLGWEGDSSGILLIMSDNIKIVQNTIDTSYTDGIEIAWDGIRYNTNCLVSKNTISNSGRHGIMVGGPEDFNLNINVKNNITKNSSAKPIILSEPPPRGITLTGNFGD